jgi:DNA-binding response OmpR family regulator
MQSKILVVDDDQPTLRLIQLVLSRKGYQVLTARTGEESLTRVSEDRPDLVVMDVMMPGMDGYEAMARIRRMPEGRSLPFVFLTALNGLDARVRGLEAGARDYVTKPLEVGELLARIRIHLDRPAETHGKTLFAFGSRPGVGVTTLAANLGLALRDVTERTVALLDWQRSEGELAQSLGVVQGQLVDDCVKSPVFSNRPLSHDVLVEYVPGLWVVSGTREDTAQPRRDPELLQKTLDQVVNFADYAIVDCGSFFQWEAPPLVPPGDGLNLCVLTPERASVKWAANVVDAVDSDEFDLWLVLNQFGLEDGVSREGIEWHVGAMKECIPMTEETSNGASADGRPAYLARPGSEYRRAMRVLAARLHKFLVS